MIDLDPMNATDHPPLYAVEVTPAPADVGMVQEALAAAGMECSAWTDTLSGTASVRVLCDNPLAAETVSVTLAEALLPWNDLFSAPVPSPRLCRIEYEDWANSWKKHFHAFRASRRILVKPSWESVTTEPGDIVLEIDPGMCFGTGYHGTTRACIEFMDDLADELGPVSFLDAGCGSGILSMAAHALGYDPIDAFDHDPQAVKTSRDNLLAAGIDSILPTVADVRDYLPDTPKRVVAVNILAEVLLRYRESIAQWVSCEPAPAYLLLSGILTPQYQAVAAAYAELGFREIRQKTLDEWTSGCFCRQ